MDNVKYWYLTEIEECVVCGCQEKLITRQYTPKPEKPEYRFKIIPMMCSNCKWLQ